MGTLRDSQEITLSLLYLISSFVSILGSSAIIYKVLRNRDETSPYDRLMLGLSTADLITSIGHGMTPFSAPRENSIRVWAVGKQASCTFLGFLTQVSFGAVLYNAMLSFYFLLIIRHRVPRHIFAQKYERWLHGIPLVFSVITASAGAFVGIYSEVEVGMGCWLNDYPPGCATHEDCISVEIGLFYGLFPILFTFLALIINNIFVYLAVRKAFRKSDVTEMERQTRQKLQRREVAVQGFLYVAAFLVCIWPLVALRLMEAYSPEALDSGDIDAELYWLLLLQSMFLPLQGFLNMCIYNRPSFGRKRLVEPNMSILVATERACLDPNIPRFQEIVLRGAAPGVPLRRRDAKTPVACASVEGDSEGKSTIGIGKNQPSNREYNMDQNVEETSKAEPSMTSIVVVESNNLSQYTALTTELAPSGWTVKESQEEDGDNMTKGEHDCNGVTAAQSSMLDSSAVIASRSHPSCDAHGWHGESLLVSGMFSYTPSEAQDVTAECYRHN